ITENLSHAVKSLKGSSGIYCITNQENGQMYIGSSVNLGNRLTAHFVNGSSNAHLQFAIAKYGLIAFTFSVIELVAKDQLLAREQFWLDWLFSLPAERRYNYLPTAGSLLGYKHSDETRAKMSGENHPMYGKTHTEESRAKTSATAIRS
ncbi:hypothetical protein BC936DRAFT_142731, partial [Jimgerdemannia flammicorona]